MARYYMEVEAFQYVDRTPEEMITYPEWFHKEIAAGRIIECGADFHIMDPDIGINEHIMPGDYVTRDELEFDRPVIACIPEEDFELAFKELKQQ